MVAALGRLDHRPVVLAFQGGEGKGEGKEGVREGGRGGGMGGGEQWDWGGAR